jgi:hypothetical protein
MQPFCFPPSEDAMRVAYTTAIVVGLAMSCGVARANTVYDVAQDFSIASNPNGVWTYGYETTLGGPLTLYSYSTATDHPPIEEW